jgi:hypothetical protein
MSNVALHMFDDARTRALFTEVRRIVRPQGLFLFHVNALADRPLRAKRKPPVYELTPNYILEADGQTMHFFSAAYLRQLLTGWGGGAPGVDRDRRAYHGGTIQMCLAWRGTRVTLAMCRTGQRHSHTAALSGLESMRSAAPGQ